MKKIIFSLAGTLIVSMLMAADLTGVKIYINPGHGGYNGNDRSVATIPFPKTYVDSTGFWESSSNLTKGLELRDLLESSNATVYLSRTDNRSGFRDNGYSGFEHIQDSSYGDRPLSVIAAEASANNVDAFLSIHSNAATGTVNYLFLMCPGNSGEGDLNFRDNQTEKLARACYPYLLDNPLDVWTHYYPYNANNVKILCYVTSYTVIGSALTVPGFLSEGSFHDYKPETHRLLNLDYRKLEAYRFFQFYSAFFTSDMPATGVVAGDVRDAKERMTNSLYLPVISGSKDQWTPINGAKVYLCKTDYTPVQEYTVDTCYNGVFVFWNVEPGNYKLRYIAEEYIGDTIDITVAAGKITTQNALLVNKNWEPSGPVRVNHGNYPKPVQDAGAVVAKEFPMENISNNTTSFLDGLTIRRSIIKGEKMYVLTDDSKLFIVNSITGDSIAEMNTANVTGGDRALSDIAFTSDTVLLGCNMGIISLPATTGQLFKVYQWAKDTSAAEVLFTSTKQGNWSNGEVGATMAISGPSWNFRLITTATTTGSSRQIRIIGLEYNLDEKLVILEKYMMDATKYTEALWGTDVKFMVSPRDTNSFIVDSKIMMPTEYQFNWEAADRSPLIEKGVMSESLLAKEAYGANYFLYAGHALMAAPTCDATSANVGVTLFDINEGLDKAVAVSQKLPNAGLGTTPANHMMAAAVVDGYDITATIFAQNEGLARFKTTSDAVINIFAYDLRYEKAAEQHKFTFSLNENATSVDIIFLKDNVEIGQKSLGALLKGAQTVNLSSSDLPVEDNMTFAIKASASSVLRVSKFSDATNAATQFYNSYGVAIDNNPENSTFARMYIANAKAGTCDGGRNTGSGIYISDPLMGDPTNQGNTVYAGGQTWGASNSPYRLSVAEDGRVFIADWSDGHSGVYIMDSKTPSANFKLLYEGCTRAASGLFTNTSDVAVGGSTPGLCVVGKGEGTQLFVLDEDYIATGEKGNNVLRYDLGTAENWQVAPSAVVFDNGTAGNLLQNGNSRVIVDTTGGMWISQYRAIDEPGIPSLIHVDATGTVDFNSGAVDPNLIGNSRNGGMAMNVEGSRLAVAGQGVLRVYAISYDAAGPSLTLLHSFATGNGNNTNDVAFDFAGNVYSVSNSGERLVAFSLPKADNMTVTPAMSTLLISNKTVGVQNVAIDNQAVVYVRNNQLFVEAFEGESIELYTVTGIRLATRMAQTGVNVFDLTKNQVVIVKAGDRVAKVIM
jgi:hypothetical protein